MTRVFLDVWGKKTSTYVGRKIKIYRDSDVPFGGQRVGGIRISHMSHITEPQTVMLTVTRGKKAPFVVDPLPAAAPIITTEQADDIAALITAAVDKAELDAIAAQLKTFDLADHRGRLFELWKSRLTELESASNSGAKPEPAQVKAPTIRERLVTALVHEGKADEAEQVGYLSGEFKRAIKVLDDLTDAEALEMTEFLESEQAKASGS